VLPPLVRSPRGGSDGAYDGTIVVFYELHRTEHESTQMISVEPSQGPMNRSLHLSYTIVTRTACVAQIRPLFLVMLAQK